MLQTVGQFRAIWVCAFLLVSANGVFSAHPPTSRPARAARLDLLYLHARLLTSDAGLPEAARPVFDDAARQKTWAAARTPVALISPAEVDSLVAAFAARPGATITSGTPTMLFPNRRVKTPSVLSPATRPADQPRFEIKTVIGPEDVQGELPLNLTVVITLPAPRGAKAAEARTWSTKVAVATPVDRTLLVDLLPPASATAPRALLLIRPSEHAVDRKDPAAAAQVAGDLYRAWDRAWPLLTELAASIQNRRYGDARRQAAQIREQLRPALDAAEGTDYATDAAAIAEHLDATATAIRKFEPDRAAEAFRQFEEAGDRLQGRLTRLLSDAGRLPPAPATRPRS